MANYHRFSESVQATSLFNAVPSSGTQTTAALDTLGFRRCALYVDIVTGSATTAKIQVTECDTSGGSYSSAITGSDTPGTAQAQNLPASGTAGQAYVLDIDLSKRKRFLKISVVGTGTAGNVCVGALLYEATFDAVTQPFTAVHL